MRELTTNETRIIDLIKIFEDACDKRKLVIGLKGDFAAVKTVYKLETELKICKALKISQPDPTVDNYSILFALPEFNKYTAFMLKQVGMTLKSDGTVFTFDNILIPNDYLDR